jgi:hypothetical protein
MFVNAEREFDRLSASRSENLSGDFVYQAYSGAFSSSRSSSQFRQRVNERLREERFSMDVASSRSLYRNGPTDDQVQQFGNCINSLSGAGFVFVSASLPATTGQGVITIPITVHWQAPGIASRPPRLRVSVTGGRIEGRSSATPRVVSMSGRRSLTITKDPGAEAVIVTLESENQSDMVTIDLTPPARMVRVREEKVCSEADRCEGWDIVLACLPSPETHDAPSGQWIVGPMHPEHGTTPVRTTLIDFGSWGNGECNVQGTGWHAFIGTCRTARGRGLQRCDSVRVGRMVFVPEASLWRPS